MAMIPPKLYEAFEKIRLGKTDEGIRLFDRVDGVDPIKSIAMAEVSYFQHDWKRGMSFAKEFFESDQDWETVRYNMQEYKRLHLHLLVIGTMKHNCWKETRTFLEEWRKNEPHQDKKYNNHNDIISTIALVSDPDNTTRLICESNPRIRKEGKESFPHLESLLNQSRKEKKGSYMRRFYKRSIRNIRLNTSSENHALFYQKYFGQLDVARDHSEAAKTFIALNDHAKAKEAIRQYMSLWKHKEPYQVAPIILFTDYELWPIMSDQRFTVSLLTIPHNLES